MKNFEKKFTILNFKNVELNMFQVSREKHLPNQHYLHSFCHGVIILTRSNNSYISNETSAPQQTGGFIIKYYFGISNITACR